MHKLSDLPDGDYWVYSAFETFIYAGRGPNPGPDAPDTLALRDAQASYEQARWLASDALWDWHKLVFKSGLDRQALIDIMSSSSGGRLAFDGGALTFSPATDNPDMEAAMSAYDVLATYCVGARAAAGKPTP